jgi:hypothetical protein
MNLARAVGTRGNRSERLWVQLRYLHGARAPVVEGVADAADANVIVPEKIVTIIHSCMEVFCATIARIS